MSHVYISLRHYVRSIMIFVCFVVDQSIWVSVYNSRHVIFLLSFVGSYANHKKVLIAELVKFYSIIVLSDSFCFFVLW